MAIVEGEVHAHKQIRVALPIVVQFLRINEDRSKARLLKNFVLLHQYAY